jgi:hypothetical protein
MLQGGLDAWLWLLFPIVPALVAFAFSGTAKAWSRWAENREMTSPARSLPPQVRKVRKVRKLGLQLRASTEHFASAGVERVRV